MKLGHVIAAAVLLAPVPFAGMTTPAAASSVHTVVIGTTLQVSDGGGALERRHTYTTHPGRTFNLTHDRPRDRVVFKFCADDETRGELRVEVLLQPSQRVDALAEVKLYEETTCENQDLEGNDWDTTSAAPGGTGQIENLYVSNYREFGSFDYVKADVTITNKPSNDTGLIKRLCSAPGSCREKIVPRNS